jgi:hypothetical protein
MGTLVEPGLFSAEGRTAELLRVSPKMLEGAWTPTLQELLAPMDDIEPCLIAVRDVPPLILSDRAQMWVANDQSGFFCSALTEIMQYPRARVCRILWLGGTRLADCIFLAESLEHWAKNQGARYMAADGREGWARVANKIGYKQTHSSIMKDLANGKGS